ncbi:SGNH/GDSL hydrolase family protein [Streptacidiphilus jiangxiensis]|uniref:GDSL-like Lipase/Acylhydrolase family protein n=1 Tax=Streptacidiphilus jiangxiensis TaxID=235985 RepID=A0A1H7TMK9_STRJI|nr:SGNH/GDSL hydrolase family protein [Streptacidiphilus jiangxiensis]SEL85596.1 GDSL-like Lipase/Acylhydrolase family protein [Streptacidiphilus jiangxiensis]
MRTPTPRRFLAGTLAVGAVLTGALALAPSAHAVSGGYSALGDSYSSGVGSGSYTSASGSCYQSTLSYPYLWQQANSPDSFDFEACSGATTTDVLNNQLANLNSATTEVSITIGGNDAGFSSAMETCVLDGTSSCLSAVKTAENFINTQLAPKLDAVYSAISADAPNAHVVVLDYPHLYAVPGDCLFGISNTSRTAINGAADDLDGVIANEVAKYGGFSFADVRSAFSGHEICTDDAWLHSTTLPIYESYHPTATGQADGFLPVFSANA